MPAYDVLDEAWMEARPALVYAALLAEFDGETSWWRPNLSFRRMGERRAGETGALHELSILNRSRRVVFSLKTVEVRRSQLIRVRYVQGPFRGEGLWTLAGAAGGTTLSYRWRVRPKGFAARLLSLLFGAPKLQSQVMQAGFEALARHLAQRETLQA